MLCCHRDTLGGRLHCGTATSLATSTACCCCRGDLYSVSWLENADAVASEKIRESLAQQYFLVRNRTYMSHVMQYGDRGFVSDSIWAFEGGGGHNGVTADPASTRGAGTLDQAATDSESASGAYSGAYAAGAGSSEALSALRATHHDAAAAAASLPKSYHVAAALGGRRAAKRAARMGKRGRQQAVLGSAALLAQAQAGSASASSSSHWDARTASLQSLWLRYAQANAAGDAVRADALYGELAQELQRNARFHDAFTAIAQRELRQPSAEHALRQHTTVTHWACYKAVNNALISGAACGPYTDVALQYARLVSRLCDLKGGDGAAALAVVESACATTLPMSQSASALSEAAASWA